MTNLDTLARSSAAQLHASVASAAPPRIDPGQPTRYSPGRMRAFTFAGLAVVVIGAIVVFNLLTRQDEPIDVLPGPAGELGFYPTGLMSSACWWCETVLLEDGRVLVINGDHAGSKWVVEVFDPETWTFSRVGDVDGECRRWASCHATTLQDGRVLFLLGHSSGFQDPSLPSDARVTAMVFDPSNDRLETLDGRLDNWFGAQTSLVLDDGRVLIGGSLEIAGGQAFARALGLFDPSDGTFLHLRSVDQWGSDLPMVPLPDGKAFVFASARGGFVFDPSDDSLTQIGTTIPASVHAARLEDGRYLVATDSGKPASLFDPVTLEFTPIDDIPMGVSGLVELDDGSVLVVPQAVFTEEDPHNPWAVFDPTTGQLEVVETQFIPYWGQRRPVPLGKGRFMFLSLNPGETAIFNTATRGFEVGPPIPTGSYPLAIESVGDGGAIVFGAESKFHGHIGYMAGLDHLERVLGERSRSAHMMVEAGADRPTGCCPEVVGEMLVSEGRPLTPSEVVSLVKGTLRFGLTSPEGGLDDVQMIAYVAELQQMLDPGEDGTEFQMGHGRVSHLIELPTNDCTQTCWFTIPAPEEDEMSEFMPWEERIDHITVEVVLIFDGPTPAADGFKVVIPE